MAKNSFTVKVKNLDKLKRDLKSFVFGIITKNDMEAILEKAKDIIYRRVKSGFGVDSDTVKSGTAKEEKLKKLSEAYKLYRQTGEVIFLTEANDLVYFKVKKPKLGRFGKYDRSNLTLSGEMLESLTYRAFSNVRGEVIVPNSMRSDGENTNAQIAEFVSDGGRPFMNFTDKDERILDAFINRLVRDKLRRQRKL